MRNLPRVCRPLRCSLLVALVALAPAAWGQININSSPNVVGSGARALGMGGAFIAVADDATAASWNPGGLTQLERPEISLVYGWKRLDESFDSTTHPELNGDYGVSLDEVNYFSLAYPFQRTIAGRNLVFSINYQRKYDFDRELDVRFRDISGLPFGNIVDVFTDVDYRQEGSLSTISPAVGFEITNDLSAGLVMNIWDSDLVHDNAWKIRTDYKTRFRINGIRPQYVWGEIVEDFDDVQGTNYTFGLLYRPAERWGIGAVYHSRLSADLEYTRLFRVRGGVPFFQSSYQKEDRTIEFPSAYGLGVSYRFPNDKLTLSLDVTRRNWDEFVQIDRRGVRTSPVSGIPKSDGFHEPTYSVRFGGEYVFIDPSLPRPKYMPSIRAGVYYDPEPASGREDTPFGLSRGDGEPEDFFGVTVGGGVLLLNRVNIDAAYEYRWGDGVRRDTFALPTTDAKVDQHHIYLSTVVYF